MKDVDFAAGGGGLPTLQQGRLLTIETPLGKDALFVQSFTGSETLSRVFTFQLELFSEQPTIPLNAIVGKPATIALELGEDRHRFFNGIVSRFGQIGRGPAGREPRYTFYRAEVVPWLWFLTRTSDCRIFQNKTVPEIVKQIFRDLGFQDFRDALVQKYTTRDYCV